MNECLLKFLLAVFAIGLLLTDNAFAPPCYLVPKLQLGNPIAVEAPASGKQVFTQ